MKRWVWIVSEGSPGHLSQSEGLVRELARSGDIETSTIETRPRLNGIARTWVRWWMGRHGRPLPMPFVRFALRCRPPTTGEAPALIVASGGKSVFAARSLAVRTGAPLVLIGERKPYPSAWFHTVLTPSPFETGENDLPLELIPTRITRQDLARAAQAWQGRPAGRLWTLIVGGSSASHRYTDADWTALGTGISALARKHGIRWLITSSRRTGAAAERVLRQALDPDAVAAAIWWAEKPEKRLLELLGSAERVFVGQDSITMITESLAAGVPVELFHPADVSFAPDSFLPSYLARLETAGRIRRHPVSSLAGLEIAGDEQPASVAEQDLAAILRQRLGWG